MYKTFNIKTFLHTSFLLFISLFVLSSWGKAQHYVQTHYGIKEGLNSALVYKTVNFPSGELFIATQRGISMFDGYRFIKNESLQSPTLALFTTNQHLYFFDSNSLQSTKSIHTKPSILVETIKTDDNPNNDHFENIFVDSQQRIWSTDFENWKYLDPKTKIINRFKLFPQNKNLSIDLDILEVNKGEVWLFAPNGIWIWDESTSKVQKFQHPSILEKKVQAAIKLKDGTMALATNDGKIFQYNHENQHFKPIYELSSKESIKGLAETDTGFYLLTTEHVYELKQTNLYKIFELEKGELTHLNFDRTTKNIWLSSTNGLIQLKPIHPSLKIWQNENLKTPIISMAKDSNGKLWGVSSNNELWTIENETIKKFAQIIPGKFYGIHSSKNSLFLSTNQVIYQFKNSKFEQLPIEVDPNHEIISCFITPQNEFWVVYSTKEMDRYYWPSLAKKSQKLQNEPSFWLDNKWQDIRIDKNNRIWLAGWMPKSFGITYYKPNQELFYDIADKKLNPNGGLFVGDYFTKIGLNHKNDLLFTAYGGWNSTDANGKLKKRVDVHQYDILDAHLRGISSDQKGNVYFATGEGLHVYRPDLDQVFRFSILDGFPTDYLVHSFLQDENNRIYIGYEGGILSFDLTTALHSELQNKLKLTQILVNGQPIEILSNELVLTKDQRDLVIQFSDLSYLAEDKVRFRYKFSDEDNWHDIPKPELILNHLSPGKYALEFEAIDNLGNKQTQSLSFSFRAKPPFLKSKFFYGLLILGIFGLIFGINQYLWRKRHEKQEDLRKIKEAEMKTLRSQMNPHFLFNTLNSINSYIIQNETENASSYLTTFSKLMRNILDNSKHEQITLKNEIDSLKLYLTLESVRLEHSFDYVISIDQSIQSENIFVPPLIIQPFAENSIWHGLRTLKSGGMLEIYAEQPDEETLILKIQDNGIGRTESAKLKKTETQHKSYGISITIDRIKSLNPENTVEIFDLYENNKPNGTLVILTLKMKDND